MFLPCSLIWGLGGAKSNVNNELIAIQSPAVLLETGKRLKLDVDYAIDGAFHKEALYGGDLPVTVDFIGFTDEQSGSFPDSAQGRWLLRHQQAQGRNP